MIKTEDMTIISQQQIAQSIYELTLSGELVSRMGTPGQFVQLKIGTGFEPLLRRPISICSIDKERGRVTLVYRAEGRGTSLLSQYGKGDTLNVLGPLGNGFNLEEAAPGETALLVGGGIGVPPLYELGLRLAEKGVRVVTVLGFQSKEAVFYEKRFREFADVYIATADGTYGHRGFVTDVIKKEKLSYDVLYACGPAAMLRAIENTYPGSRVFLSLEERMGCGIGACYACVCKTKDERPGLNYKKVCSDGPVFRAGEVVL
ncbi:dihydroorotate dehydrogenase electron transfer subunit [Bacillus testis]|uniref:dihydroorotate dehydrogenase electron transfer subunit n=1 Tax=Bacillus testis TaxID=1622072 RepID=UPI00067EF02C|nr:dihydroorotate dehydrogenase electron transfer subunit [Bacillus testis]